MNIIQTLKKHPGRVGVCCLALTLVTEILVNLAIITRNSSGNHTKLNLVSPEVEEPDQEYDPKDDKKVPEQSMESSNNTMGEEKANLIQNIEVQNRLDFEPDERLLDEKKEIHGGGILWRDWIPLAEADNIQAAWSDVGMSQVGQCWRDKSSAADSGGLSVLSEEHEDCEQEH